MLSRRELLAAVASVSAIPIIGTEAAVPGGSILAGTLTIPAAFLAAIYGGALPFGLSIKRSVAGAWTSSGRPTPIITGTPAAPSPAATTVIYMASQNATPAGNDGNTGLSAGSPILTPTKAKAIATAQGNSYVWLILDDSVTFWDYQQTWNKGFFTQPNVQITTASGGMVYFTTAVFGNTVTWTQDGANNDWYCTLPTTGANSTPLLGAKCVWDNSSGQQITQVTNAGTIKSMGFLNWASSLAACQSTPGTAFPGPVSYSASGTFTNGNTAITMGTSAPATVIAGMTVWDASLNPTKVIGTVASWVGTTLNLVSGSPYSSFGAADILLFGATTLYVHCADNRKPDSNIFMMQYGDPVLAPWISSSSTVYNVYMKNVGFWGAGTLIATGALAVTNTSASNRWSLQFDTCEFGYTGGIPLPQVNPPIGTNNVYHANGGDDMFFYNCKSTSAWNDCYNFHTGGFGASQCRLVFVNCIGVDGNQGKDNRNAWIAGDTGSNAYTIHGQSTGMVLVNCYGDSASEPLGSVAIDGGNSYTLDCGGTYAGYYTNTSLTPQTSDNNTAVLISRPTDSSFSTAWLLETTMPSTGAFNMSAEKAGTVIYTWNVTPLNRWVSPPFPSNFGGYSPPGFIPTFT